MPRLIVEKGNDKGREFRLEPGCVVVVGRDVTCGFQLRDTMCSRQHFRIEGREEDFWVIDLGSLNGTLLNGKTFKEERLINGDLLKAGETLFSYAAEAAVQDDELVGDTLGGYRILQRVGRGGMGTVYRAEQIDLQRIVALKVISAQHAKNKDFIELFVHEARAAGRLNHANIVQVYDVKKQDDLYFFSMEYVPGGSVQDVLNRQRKVPVEQAVRMVLDAARGLEYAHRKDVIHRDIKPDNLMISETGGIKIGDLGLAHRLGEKLVTDEQDSVIGTPHYIAPEQVRGKPADFRSDIYALGSTLYRMMAGFTPYQAPSVRELVNKKVREDAPPIHQVCPDVPQVLGEICGRMIARIPDDRYTTMAEVILDLERFLREASAPLDRREPTTPMEVLVGNKRLLASAVGLLVILVVGSVIGAVSMIRTASAPGPDPSLDPERERSIIGGQALENAKTLKLRLDPKREEEIQYVVREFEKVIQRFPGTDSAREAQSHIEELQHQLRVFAAAGSFAAVDKLDGDLWRKMYQNFQSGTFDPGPIDAAIAAYQRFASEEKTRETPSGKEAAERAAFIASWKARVEEARREFDRVRTEAIRRRDDERFNRAWESLEEFKQKFIGKRVECPFAVDRYATLLFEEAAGGEQKKILDSVKVAFYKVEERVRDLERERRFEDGMKLLSHVTEDYPEEFRLKALVLSNGLSEAAARFRREEEERVAREREKALVTDLEEWERIAREVRKDVLSHDFRAAHDKVNRAVGGSGPFPRTEAVRERLKNRFTELAYLADFKDTLRKVINDPKNYPSFRREQSFVSTPGVIIRMDDRDFEIRIDDSGGRVTIPLKTLKPLDFYKYVRGATKWTDARLLCGIAVYCAEFGLYEHALEELSTVRSLLAARPDRLIEAFVESRRLSLEAGEYSDSDEIEAEKRLARLKLFASGEDLEAARREIELLKTRYRTTRAVSDLRNDLEDQLQKIIRAGGEKMRDKVRSELQKRIFDFKISARNEILENQAAILGRLNRVEDQLWRNIRMGAFYSASGNLPLSTDKLLAAKGQGDRLLGDRSVARTYLTLIAGTYGQLFRNYTIAGNRKIAAELRKEAVERFTAVDAGLAKGLIERMDRWDSRYRELKDRQVLEKAVRENPENPALLWELAESCFVAGNFEDARGFLKAIKEIYPDHPAVKSGEATWVLAETMLAFHEVVAARDLYKELETAAPDHPRVRDAAGEDSVKGRLVLCYDLMVKLDILQDTPKK